MRNIPDGLPKTISVIRIATSIFFLLFGQYKIFGSAFTHGGFQEYLQSFAQNSAVGFYQPILSDLILPHAVFFGYLVGALEMFIGVSLLLGIWVRVASVLGMLHMISLTLATWWGPGPGMPIWRYFGARSLAAALPVRNILRGGCRSNVGIGRSLPSFESEVDADNALLRNDS
jgi:uncharacterized membrane protein YphA (DoxX/SURF4 family)